MTAADPDTGNAERVGQIVIDTLDLTVLDHGLVDTLIDRLEAEGLIAADAQPATVTP